MEGEWSRPHMEDWEQISIGSKNRVREADLAAQFTFFPQMDPKVCDCKKVAALVRAMDHECGEHFVFVASYGRTGPLSLLAFPPVHHSSYTTRTYHPVSAQA